MPFTTRIVPMPHWSTPLGCTKLFLTIVVLAFVTACTAIWGWYLAFAVTIFSASLSLLAFGYYLTSLSFNPRIYNKWLVLSLETALTLLWFASLLLLAGWTGASSGISQYYYTLDPNPTPYGGPYDGPYGGESSDALHSRSLDRSDLLEHSWEPFRLNKRQDFVDMPRTVVRVHGAEARYAAQILAGISAGLAGFIFIMYAVTLATYTLNFHNDIPEHVRNSSSTATRTDDEEMQLQTVPPHHSSTNANTDHNPPTPTSPAITTPLDINALPKDFEPKPQKQEFYLNPAEATEAGIEPPTPLLRALRLEKEREKETDMKMEKEQNVALDGKAENEGMEKQTGNESKSEGRGKIEVVQKRDIIRDDGRIEREL